MLSEKENKAIGKFKNNIINKFPGSKLVLYGSKARGKGDEWSDIDILVLLNELSKSNEDLVYDIAYDIDLQFDLVISPLVESKSFWQSPLAKEMPIHKNIQKEGIRV